MPHSSFTTIRKEREVQWRVQAEGWGDLADELKIYIFLKENYIMVAYRSGTVHSKVHVNCQYSMQLLPKFKCHPKSFMELQTHIIYSKH